MKSWLPTFAFVAPIVAGMFILFELAVGRFGVLEQIVAGLFIASPFIALATLSPASERLAAVAPAGVIAGVVHIYTGFWWAGLAAGAAVFLLARSLASHFNRPQPPDPPAAPP